MKIIELTKIPNETESDYINNEHQFIFFQNSFYKEIAELIYDKSDYEEGFASFFEYAKYGKFKGLLIDYCEMGLPFQLIEDNVLIIDHLHIKDNTQMSIKLFFPSEVWKLTFSYRSYENNFTIVNLNEMNKFMDLFWLYQK